MAIQSNNDLCQHEMKIPAIYFLNASYCEDFSLLAYYMPNSSDHLVCLNPIPFLQSSARSLSANCLHPINNRRIELSSRSSFFSFFDSLIHLGVTILKKGSVAIFPFYCHFNVKAKCQFKWI